MWWRASIDGYASDTCGLGLGQQQGVLHCNACSAGTFGHMPPPLQLFSSRQSPQSLADEMHALLPLSTGLVDQEGVTVAVRQGEQYWLKELDLAHPWWLYLFTPTSELFQPLNHSSSVFAVELEASPACSPGLPPCPNKLNCRKGKQQSNKKKGLVSRQFNYPTRLLKVLSNSRLDLVSLIPTCHKHIPNLHQLTQRGMTGWS